MEMPCTVNIMDHLSDVLAVIWTSIDFKHFLTMHENCALNCLVQLLYLLAGFPL